LWFFFFGFCGLDEPVGDDDGEILVPDEYTESVG